MNNNTERHPLRVRIERYFETLKHHWGAFLFVCILLLWTLLGVESTAFLKLVVYENSFMSAFILALLMCGATVIAPVTLLPVVPMIAPILGPCTTAISVWIGWTLGAGIAFVIARYGGRPILTRFMSLERLDSLQKRVPENSHFLLVFALRLIVPVDLLSYALGLFSTISFLTYMLASILGILWFSFAFAYLGYAIKEGDTVLFVAYSVVSGIIALSSLWYVRRSMKE
jgi:uncharacterized membrane protein YdjX (TVP38/TMEM64 family)